MCVGGLLWVLHLVASVGCVCMGTDVCEIKGVAVCVGGAVGGTSVCVGVYCRRRENTVSMQPLVCFLTSLSLCEIIRLTNDRLAFGILVKLSSICNKNEQTR